MSQLLKSSTSLAGSLASSSRARLLLPTRARTCVSMASSCPAPQKVVVIGGVAGGASCAARLRRLSETCEITIFERGPYVSFANW